MDNLQQLKKRLDDWSEKHDVKCMHEPDTRLGERFEIRWFDRDRAVVRFIDVYPRDNGKRVVLQRGIFDATTIETMAPEGEREKGPLFSRAADEVEIILNDLKPEPVPALAATR